MSKKAAREWAPLGSINVEAAGGSPAGQPAGRRRYGLGVATDDKESREMRSPTYFVDSF
jgi:hypothetical protein